MLTPTLAERMARFAVGLRYEQLPPDVVHEVKRRVLDSLGCAFGAFQSEPGRIARQVASAIHADDGFAATLWGTEHRTSADWATFANGCLVRYLDYNDTYLSLEPAHPSDNIPAALAAAEAGAATGRQLITAIAAAYEVQCRLCDAASLRAIGWDHVTYGAFSSAVAAGMLLGLNTDQLRHALGIAGVTSAALRQTRVGELSHWKGCAFANAARHGVYAALLARAGMTGPHPIFEGEKGFEKLVSGPLPVKGPFATAGVPESDPGWMILRTSIKCWPVEYHAQSAVDAALALRSQIVSDKRGSPDQIYDAVREIVVDGHDAAVDIIGSEPEKWRPTSRETADHSLPYIVAAALADGEVTPVQFEPARFTDAGLLSLVARVVVRRHDELSRLYPEAVGNIVTVLLNDGRTLTRRVDHALGHANNPMSDDDVRAKFRRQADPILGPQRAAALASSVWRLEEIDRVTDLLRQLRVPA
jgi:2-methylcitrate dehydratase